MVIFHSYVSLPEGMFEIIFLMIIMILQGFKPRRLEQRE
jgi:hypothetical protein